MRWHRALLVLLSIGRALESTATDKPAGIASARIWLSCPNPCMNGGMEVASDVAVSILNSFPQFSFNVTADPLHLWSSPEGSSMRAMTDLWGMSNKTDPYVAAVASFGGDESVTTFANAGFINVITQLQPLRLDMNPFTKRPYYTRVGVDPSNTAGMMMNTMKFFGWKKFIFVLDGTVPEYVTAPDTWKAMAASDPSGPQVEVMKMLSVDTIPDTLQKIRESGITVMWLKINAQMEWICAMSDASMIAPMYTLGFFLSPKTKATLTNGKVCSWDKARRVMMGGLYTGLESWGDMSQVTTFGLPIGAIRGKIMQSIGAANAVNPGWLGGRMPFACPTQVEGYMFDAIAAMALAVHDILQISPDFLKNFKYDATTAAVLQKAIANLTFIGATGDVKFLPDGTRMSNLRLQKLNESGSWSTQATVSLLYPTPDPDFKLVEPWRWCDVEVDCRTLTSDMLGQDLSELKKQGLVPFGFIQDCPQGQFRGPLECQLCPNGTYAPEKGVQHECLLCQAGFHCPEGSWMQLPCESGTFSSWGASECSECPEGTSQFLPLSDKCPVCQPGFVQPKAGQKACLACQEGEYQDLVGNTTCKTCAATLTTAKDASTDIDQCGCGVGSYFVSETGTCKKCSEGVVCSSFNMEPLVDRGYYMLPNARRDVADLDVYKCMSELACPGQKTMNDSVCADKFSVDSINCGLCEDGHYLSGGSCAKCGANNFVMPFTMLAFYLFAGALHYLWNMKATATVEAGEGILASITFGLTLAFVQSLGIFNRLHLVWPSEFKDLLEVLSLFLFDTDFLRPSCIIDTSLASAYIMRLSVPLFMCAVFISWSPLSTLLHKLTGGRFPKFEWNGIFCSIGMVIQALYISLSASTLSLLECYESPNGERTIRAYSFAVCGTSEYNAMIPFLLLALLVYVIGIFAVFVYLSIVAPVEYIRPNFRIRIRFLVFKFRSNLWWYSLVLMVRSLALAMVTVIFPSDPYHQFLAMVVILVFGLCTHLLLTPYLDSYANNLETTELCVLIAIMVVGSWFMTPRDLESAEAMTLSVILICLSVITFVVLGLVFCWAVYLAAFPLKALAMHEKEVNNILPTLSDTCTILAGTEEKTLKGILQHASYVDRWHVYEMVHFIQLELCGLQSPKFVYKRLPKLTESVIVAKGKEQIRRLSQESIAKITRSYSATSMEGDKQASSDLVEDITL